MFIKLSTADLILVPLLFEIMFPLLSCHSMLTKLYGESGSTLAVQVKLNDVYSNLTIDEGRATVGLSKNDFIKLYL